VPLARISIPSSLSNDKTVALADAVHLGLVRTCGVPMDDRFQLLTRYASDMMLLNPTYPNVNRSSEASVVEIMFLRGRTDAQKEALYQYIVDRAVEAEFRPDDILIALVENTHIDWSLGGGKSFSKQMEALPRSS